MNDHNDLIPEQHTGIQKKSSESVEFDSVEAARQFFQVARKRLLDINNWQHISTGLSSTFILRDAQGQSIGHRFPEVGDYMQIDIPGPEPKAGDGHDWVRIEAIEETKNTAADEMTIIRVRPAPSPVDNQAEVAHFLDDQATSTFAVFRLGSTVTAEVYGHNETANTHTEGLADKVRNVVVAVGSWLGFSDAQWGNLTKGIVQN